MTIIRVIVAWILFGAIAATLVFGPALLRVVVLGPISLVSVLAT